MIYKSQTRVEVCIYYHFKHSFQLISILEVLSDIFPELCVAVNQYYTKTGLNVNLKLQTILLSHVNRLILK